MTGFRLVLGTPINTTVKPWMYMDVDAVMVNSYDILKAGSLDRLRGRGLRRLLGIGDEVELWIDSGGYQFLSRGITVDPHKIARVYREVDADYYISLDYPPGPRDDADLRAMKIAKSINNFMTMRSVLRDHVEEGRLVPVFHIATSESLRLQLQAYVPHATTAAVGGLIPYIMQQAGNGSRLKAVMFMVLMRKLWEGRLHAMGLASAAMIPLLKKIDIDSGDTQTWRLKAAYGKIIIPGLGERHISGQAVRFGPAKLVRESELRLYREYIEKAVSAGIISSPESLSSSFEERALFNAWILGLVAANGTGYSGASPAFAKLHRVVDALNMLPPSRLEELLEMLLEGSMDYSQAVRTVMQEAVGVVEETRSRADEGVELHRYRGGSTLAGTVEGAGA
ncbi:MAG: hypothetical protein GXO15_03330 [Crenarchaeota archaeon]|nr:hypothetical protein [Thermoproteota archaeon]